MAENKSVRLILVELLSQIEGRQASEALAGRALFDLNDEVRQAALKALKNRPAEEYLPALLLGFQYPWQAAAEHAAEALVMLELRAAVPRLIPLLDRDPEKPLAVDLNQRRVTVVPELVRINHLGNCLLCHAPSFTTTDLVRGRVPLPGQALPAPVSTPQYYEGNQGIFVRADVTYLKQDFSVNQPVPHPGPWPAYQRFDYLVRLRPVAPLELNLLEKKAKQGPTITPRREALLFALRELTGKDLGPLSEHWKQFLPIRDTGNGPEEAEVGPKVGADLPSPGSDPVASGRQALAEFLAQIPVKDLRARLKDSSREVRHAAVLACELSKANALLPDLTERLKDSDPAIARDAERVLTRLDPTFPFRAEAVRLGAALADAGPAEQGQLVQKFRVGKGPAFDLALARVIPNLPLAVRPKARAALTERLEALTPQQLREKLHDGDRELRQAAVLATARKKVWSLVPDLIPLLNDADRTIIQAARQALREITRRDVGPEAGVAQVSRIEIMADWQTWWKAQGTR
jgi:HEAT repeat protein